MTHHPLTLEIAGINCSTSIFSLTYENLPVRLSFLSFIFQWFIDFWACFDDLSPYLKPISALPFKRWFSSEKRLRLTLSIFNVFSSWRAAFFDDFDIQSSHWHVSDHWRISYDHHALTSIYSWIALLLSPNIVLTLPELIFPVSNPCTQLASPNYCGSCLTAPAVLSAHRRWPGRRWLFRRFYAFPSWNNLPAKSVNVTKSRKTTSEPLKNVRMSSIPNCAKLNRHFDTQFYSPVLQMSVYHVIWSIVHADREYSKIMAYLSWCTWMWSENIRNFYEYFNHLFACLCSFERYPNYILYPRTTNVFYTESGENVSRTSRMIAFSQEK